MSVNPMVYETQFFGFTPQTFMLRIYMAFQDHLAHLMMVVEETILKKLEGVQSSKLTPSVIRRGTEQFFSFTKQHFNHLFGKMEEMFLNMVLKIPPNVLLPEDRVQEETRYTAEQFQDLQEEIGQLDRRVKEEISAERALHAELEQQKVVQAHLEGVLRWFDGLDNAGREEGVSSLKESFAALTKTSAKLHGIVQEVTKKMNHLENKK